MTYFELEHNGEHIRVEWNGKANFNLQTSVGGSWVDYHCFTNYEVETEQEALECAWDHLNEDTSISTEDVQ
jgi:hypothetical protein